MGIALLMTAGDADPLVGPNAAERLAALGITSISLLRDGSETGVLLEGWAFDAAEAMQARHVLFPDAGVEVRVLQEVESIELSPAIGARTQGRPQAKAEPTTRGLESP